MRVGAGPSWARRGFRWAGAMIHGPWRRRSLRTAEPPSANPQWSSLSTGKSMSTPLQYPQSPASVSVCSYSGTPLCDVAQWSRQRSWRTPPYSIKWFCWTWGYGWRLTVVGFASRYPRVRWLWGPDPCWSGCSTPIDGSSWLYVRFPLNGLIFPRKTGLDSALWLDGWRCSLSLPLCDYPHR